MSDQPAASDQQWFLCYVEAPWAWFVDTADFDVLRTDDWDDQYDPGPPFDPRPDEVQYDRLRVAFETPETWDREQGSHRYLVSPRACPDTINENDLPWLVESWSRDGGPVDGGVTIPTRASVEAFTAGVEAFGGTVYRPTAADDTTPTRQTDTTGCPRCEEGYARRYSPGDIGRMTVYGSRVICEHDGWLYFHDEHSRLD